MTGGLIIIAIIVYWLLDGGTYHAPGDLGHVGTVLSILFWAVVLAVTFKAACWSAKAQERRDNSRVNRYKKHWE